ncbi:MAG TPA: hypothetical protein DFI00_04600 [Rhodospirillaceae bacterium]|nr:hypothetical protein [Alphaproteobacteria bacterium]OUT40862.1 MAG: hypothetical protein CBB62_00370 [Micavibrio sp. TMED2]HCI46550.1 hypothetical protein [Rhodospirillaceae bacterium]MAS47658.1 hypothetical protein [Alphaproteobacteria bacterium]MAX96470.1 hypothetical protein [Alphaproteobacteria bacterium]|tara:strand:+ start:15240 stop:15893 length:654 start_codon:yes stop_codon:yes gene_type:complete
MGFDREKITPELMELARRMGDRLAEHRLLSPTWQTDHGFLAFLSETLPFYPGARLLIFPMAGARLGQPQERTVIEHNDFLYILAGGLAPVMEANAAVPLALNKGNVADYLRFYLTYVSDKAGGIKLVEEPYQIPWIEAEGEYQEPAVNKLVRPLRLIDTDDDGYVLNGTGLYQDAMFRATFRVGYDGTLIIEDEEQIASDLNIRHAGNIPQPFATTG